MSWLKRVTGMQELIDEQKRILHIVLEIEYKVNERAKEPEMPRIKKYK